MKPPLRLGVVGLGMMGRHHARIAANLTDVAFVGGVDPAGDKHRCLAGHPLFDDLDSLLAAGIDAAVVAVPSDEHASVVTRLAAAGVHCLIEKPVAPTLAGAIEIREACTTCGIIALVGHVERYNPAVRAMRQRLREGAVGPVIAITTRRVGPHPNRIRDLGVVKDLATHDIDLVHWIGGEFDTVTAQVAHILGGPHEDLLEAIGRLRDGIVVSLSVNWVTPTKERSIKVLGERGALVADLLSADLTFFANADVPMEWESMARLRGVSEGDMVRYALRKPEPLALELENFRDAVLARPDAQCVSLDEGIEALRVAERILEGR